MSSSQSPLLWAQGIQKTYSMARGGLEILHGLDLLIHEGDLICIMGASGSGKSTLLHILGTLDRPTNGQILYQGQDLFSRSDEWLAGFRNQKMGFVFQFHHLLAEFTALENVMMPSRIAGDSAREARRRAEGLLDEMGVLARKSHHPSEMSGGEQQRVAIARALARSPEVLFADEPTGNLDSANAARIQDIFLELNRKRRLALVAVTHDPEFARKFPKSLTIRDGRWADVRSAPQVQV